MRSLVIVYVGFSFQAGSRTVRPVVYHFTGGPYFDNINLLAIFLGFSSFFLGGIGYLGKPWAEETQKNHVQ